MKRPFESSRPVGPFAQGVMGDGDCKLMVGFPVELSHSGMRDPPEDPLSEIRSGVARRFNIEEPVVSYADVRLSGFDAPVVKFVYFPVGSVENPETAMNIANYPDMADAVVREVTGKSLNANVSIWAGGRRSGEMVASE